MEKEFSKHTGEQGHPKQRSDMSKEIRPDEVGKWTDLQKRSNER